jgi:hypothetical protein
MMQSVGNLREFDTLLLISSSSEGLPLVKQKQNQYYCEKIQSERVAHLCVGRVDGGRDKKIP